MIEVSNLSYGRGKKTIINNMSFSIPEAKIIGLLGPNGSGKTTLMQLICGFLFKDSGEIKLDGINTRRKLQQEIVYMNHEFHFPKTWKIAQVAKFFEQTTTRFNHQRFMGMVKSLNINMQLDIQSLSRGELEKVNLMLTLAQNAKYYFLDEPLTGTDIVVRQELIKNLLMFADEHATLFISSHLIETFEVLMDEVLFISDGQVLGQYDCDTIRNVENMSIQDYYLQIYGGKK